MKKVNVDKQKLASCVGKVVKNASLENTSHGKGTIQLNFTDGSQLIAASEIFGVNLEVEVRA